jgi:hypothetical protein
MERLVILEDGNASRAKVTRKYDGPLTTGVVDGELNAGRTKHMTSFYPSGLDSRSDRDRFVVGDGTHAADDLFGVLPFVKGILRRLAFAPKATILALGILRLNLRGVAENKRSHIDRGWSREHRAAITELGQQRKTARVIEMAVG